MQQLQQIRGVTLYLKVVPYYVQVSQSLLVQDTVDRVPNLRVYNWGDPCNSDLWWD